MAKFSALLVVITFFAYNLVAVINDNITVWQFHIIVMLLLIYGQISILIMKEERK